MSLCILLQQAQEAKKQAEAGLQSSNIIKTETASLKKDAEGLKKPYDELGMHLAELRALKELVKKKLAAVKENFPQFEAAKDTGKVNGHYYTFFYSNKILQYNTSYIKILLYFLVPIQHYRGGTARSKRQWLLQGHQHKDMHINRN